jgi:hypothetical protein
MKKFKNKSKKLYTSSKGYYKTCRRRKAEKDTKVTKEEIIAWAPKLVRTIPADEKGMGAFNPNFISSVII